MRLLGWAVPAALVLSASAYGQISIAPVVIRPASPNPATAAAALQAAVAGATPAASANPAETLKQQRLQKIKQLQFDRRPSSILKAWLAFSKEQKKKAAEAEKASTKPAADAIQTKPEPEKDETPQEESKEEKSNKDEKPAGTEPPADAKAGDERAKEGQPDDEAKSKTEAAKKKADEEKAKAEQARIKAEHEKALKELDRQLKDFQRDVTLGRWSEVQAFLASLEKEEAKAAYARLLDGLRSGPPNPRGNVDPQMLQQLILNSADQSTMQAAMSAGGQGPGAAFLEKNQFSMADIAGLIAAAPHPLDEDCFSKLGTILRQTLAAGHVLEELLSELGVDKQGTDGQLGKRDLARLICASGEEARAGEFLPTPEEARRDSDAQALNLLARHYLAKHRQDKKATLLESAWTATQDVLALEAPPDEAEQADEAESKPPETAAVANKPAAAEKSPQEQAAEKAVEDAKKKRAELRGEIKAALTRAVELAPRLRDELGQKWLDESFQTRIERGREILVTLGTQVSMNLQSRPSDADFRLKSLELQRTTVEALLRAAPETAAAWKDSLTLLAANWLKEADVSYRLDNRDQYGLQWQRDRYGNYYFFDEDGNSSLNRFQNRNVAQPIPTGDLLDARPREDWLKLVDDDLKPKFAATFSQLYLKAGEDAEAFPYVEQLAATYPDKARELAEEFLRVWTRNHNPNEGRERQNPYMYYWGYEQRADRIPLTRSKQERNLKELAGWVARLRALPIGELDEQLLANAFTTSHSKAEVYRLEAIEDVFGSLDHLKPRTLAELIQQMRGNLAGVWRLPDVQKQNSTNRKQRDIQAEVKRGYELARTVVGQALEKHPDHWALVMAEAAVMHDENDFHQELEKSSEFSERRQAALARYQRAAELYAAAVGELAEDEQTTQVYEQWFYAGLGAVDLGRITAEKVADDRQPARIHQAITSLPGETAEFHLSKFANNLFTRIGSAKPELKYRYLKSGFEIVGDHKMAREARKLLDYYGDLVSEIKLEAKIDGPDSVGHEQPFGVFVNILHTKEIERESGGFGRYLQNQNSNLNFYYNFGRPTQNYRDKFRDTVTQAIGEQFEVVSITFQEPEVNSKAGSPYGWRVTPYAYLLLKARGPEIDKISPMRLDLDFLDTSGYAMLPVETPAVPIDANSDKPPARPASEIKLVQTLDERQSADGKLILEVRASGRGLMPGLDELMDFKIQGFKKVDEEGGDLSVSQFDKESDETAVLSERVWLVTMRADDQAAPPETFHFAEAKLPLKEALYQRYEDADLVAVEPEISLVARYDQTDYAWLWIPLVALVVVGAGGLAVVRAARGWRREAPARFRVPEQVTPFTVLGLLRDIQHNNGLCEADQQDLKASIDRLERHFFAVSESPEPDLQTIATSWVAKTSNPR